MPGDYGWQYHHSFDPTWWSTGHVVAGAISMLFWLALMGFMVWWLYQLGNRQPPRVRQPAAPSAMELLRQRYVMGDIDAITFEEMVERVMASEAWERQEQVQRLVRPRPPLASTPPKSYLPPEPPEPPSPTVEM